MINDHVRDVNPHQSPQLKSGNAYSEHRVGVKTFKGSKWPSVKEKKDL